MTRNRSLLFVHGGPGLNSGLEIATLEAPLRAAGWNPLFWEEPSRLRPSGPAFRGERAFAHLVDSLAESLSSLPAPVTLVFHSWGAHPVLALPPDLLERSDHWVAVATTFALDDGQRNILRLAESDLRPDRPADADQLRLRLTQSKAFFDEQMRAALGIALTDEHLFSHYFQDAQVMARFFDILATPERAFDAESMFAVLSDYRASIESNVETRARLPRDVVAISGSLDPGPAPAAEAELMARLFRRVERHSFLGAGHWPHVEQPTAFVRLLGSLSHHA